METQEGRDMLFQYNPPPPHINMKKLNKFLSQMGHIKMEQADMKNNTKWFDECKERGFLDAMDYHREGVRGVFGMENYDKWRKGYTIWYVKWDKEEDWEGYWADTLFDEDDEETKEEERIKFLYQKVEVPNYIKTEDTADWISDDCGCCITELSTEPLHS